MGGRDERARHAKSRRKMKTHNNNKKKTTTEDWMMAARTQKEKYKMTVFARDVLRSGIAHAFYFLCVFLLVMTAFK